MSRCHNCGRETLRTLDWACQWCGYPIVSGGYGKIEKTYRQLKEERLWEAGEGEATEYEQELEIETGEETKIEVAEPEEKLEAEEIEVAEEAESEPEPEMQQKPEQEPEPEKEPEIKQEAETEECVAEKTAVEEIEEADVVVEVIACEEEKVIPVAEVAPEPETEEAAEELNVAEIFKAYEEDDIAADERFNGKVLRVNGVVSLVDIKNVSAAHYIRLSTSEGDIMQSVQCIFDKRYTAELSHLEKGQEVTVQGRYNGSVIAMRMVDCVLIT